MAVEPETDERAPDTGEGGTPSDHHMLRDLWRDHHTPIMIALAAGTLLLTAILVFRKNNNAAGQTTGTSGTATLGSSGIPTSPTTSSVNAYDSLTQYMQAILQQLQQQGQNAASGGTSGGTSSSGGTTTPTPTPTPTPSPTPAPNPDTSGGFQPHPAANTPWWSSVLTGGPNAVSGQHTYFVLPKAMTLNQLANDFGLQHGWTDIAYNPNNAGLNGGQFLHQSYAAKGGNTLAAGTAVWIPTTRLPSSAPAGAPQLGWKQPSPVGS